MTSERNEPVTKENDDVRDEVVHGGDLLHRQLMGEDVYKQMGQVSTVRKKSVKDICHN
jgi:hypothetical protein